MSSSAHLNIAVIGAGVIGTITAYKLQRQKHNVTIYDSNDPGSVTSYGNAGTFANYACIPINNENIVKQLPSLIFGSSSPLSIQWQHSLTILPWFRKFIKFCKREQVYKIIQSLSSILQRAEISNQNLFKELKISELIREKEALYLYETEFDFEKDKNNISLREKNGVILDYLDRDDIKDLEPNLKKNFFKGILFKNSKFTTNPEKFVKKIFSKFLDINGSIIKNQVSRIDQVEKSTRIILKDNSFYDYDKIIVCAGAWSNELAKNLGEKFPMITERGYHLMYPKKAHLINRPIGIGKFGFYFTPMEEGLRAAGTVEIGLNNKNLNTKRIKWMKKKAEETFSSIGHPNMVWLGYRPTLVDSLPVISCSTKNRNVIYNFGHQHLGLTLSSVSADIVTEIISETNTNFNIIPFSAGRFNALNSY